MEASKEELKQIDKEIRKINIIGFPGAILLGLGIYGLIEENPASLHSLFGYQKFVYLLLISGALIEIWQFSKLLPLFKKRGQISKNANT